MARTISWRFWQKKCRSFGRFWSKPLSQKVMPPSPAFPSAASPLHGKNGLLLHMPVLSHIKLLHRLLGDLGRNLFWQGNARVEEDFQISSVLIRLFQHFPVKLFDSLPVHAAAHHKPPQIHPRDAVFVAIPIRPAGIKGKQPVLYKVDRSVCPIQ